jgi:hypothetical protein
VVKQAKFIFETCLQGEKRRHRFFLRSKINKYMDRLIPRINNFIILEPRKPIDDCIFIQALKRSDGFFCVEMRFQKMYSYRQYGQYVLCDELKRIFQNFLQGKFPNYNTWQDKTVKIAEEIEKRKEID